MTRFLATCLAILAAGLPLCAQDPRRPPPPFPPGHDERRWIEDGARGLDPVERERRLREWGEILEGLSPEDREAFRRLAPEAKVRRIQALVQERHQAQEKAFVDSLPEARRKELEALDEAARAVRLLELKIEQQLEKVLSEAVERKMITAEEAAVARAIDGAKARAERVLELQKALFLDVHREELDVLPEGQRDELKRLPPRAFFRAPFVAALKAQRVLGARGLMELRRLGPEAIERFLEGLKRGTIDPSQRDFLRAEILQNLDRLTPEERGRLVRELRRTMFFRDLPGGEGPQPAPRGRRPPLRLPPEMQRSLTPAEREEFLRMPPEAQETFARTRFPEWAENRRAAGAGPEPGPATLREILNRLATLPEAERERLLDRPIRDAWRELGGGDGPEGRRPPPDEPPRSGPGKERSGGPLREAIERLSPEQRKEFDALGSPKERAEYLRRLFPGAVPDSPAGPPGGRRN